MTTPLLIIISGPPCAGKSMLGAWLAGELGLPLFHRDGFKEKLFDALGWSDLEWSQRLGGASYHLLYHAVEALLRAGRSLIVESNFDPQYDTQRLRDLAARHPFLPLQIRCMAEGAVLFERFKRRVESGERHPGHLDHLNIAVYEPIVREGAGPRNDFLDLEGARIDVETTDFAQVDYPGILASVRSAIAQGEGRVAVRPRDTPGEPARLVIVTGPSGAGKTTLARRLADDMRLPLLYRDGLKETLYESLGWSDAAWSRRLGGASYELLYYVLEELLRGGTPAVVESNFDPAWAGPQFVSLQQRHGFSAAQVLCTADRAVLAERVRRRADSGERHPGHVEHLRAAEPAPQGGAVAFDFLPLDGPRLTLDTTDFARVDYAGLLAALLREGGS